MNIRSALLSVTNKTGIVELARALADMGAKVISTGGTAKMIGGAGVPCTLVESVTGFPEMLDGRLKTLHPKVHGGILANRAIPEHMTAIKGADIAPIDLVAVNLYNFKAKPSIEEIDIGGPTMLRGAAKNGEGVIVTVDPRDYGWVLKELKTDGELSEASREFLAAKVFIHMAAYDSAIAAWMKKCRRKKIHFLRSSLSRH